MPWGDGEERQVGSGTRLVPSVPQLQQSRKALKNILRGSWGGFVHQVSHVCQGFVPSPITPSASEGALKAAAG